MNRIIALLVGMLASVAIMADVHIRPINAATTVDFKLYNADGTLDVDEVDGGTEVSVSCAGGAETTATNDFVDEGTFYSIALTQAEMNCARVAVIVAATTTEVFFIDTYGASAAIPGIPALVPGAAGGLLIAGANADFDVTANVSLADGLTVTRSTSNADAVNFTGNGTGDGLVATSGSGATGAGFVAISAATNGPGASFIGAGAAPGYLTTGGTTGAGASFVGGSTSGAGAAFVGSAGNSAAATFAGQGSAAGIAATGGATGPGMLLTGGSTSGLGLRTSITAPSGSVLENGLIHSGTLNGTHSSTTADLGALAPTGDITGTTLVFPDHDERVAVLSYDTGTGVATFAAISETLANGNDWYLWGTAPGGSGSADWTADERTAMRAILGIPGSGTTPADPTSGIADTIRDYLTTNLGANGANATEAGGTGDQLTGVPWNASWDAQVQSEVDDALRALALNQLLAETYDPAAEPAADSLFGDLTESNGGLTRFTTNALETAPSGSSITDFTANERAAMFAILGIATDNATPTDPTVGILDAIRDDTTNLPTDPADASVVAGRFDTVDTALADVPTNGELTTALGTLNDLDATAVQAAAAAALDAENGANFTAIPKTAVLDYIEQFACDSGDADTCVDSSLGEADGFWRGQALRSLSGTTAGMERCIVASDQSSTDATVVPPFPASLGTGTVQIVASPLCAGVDPTYTP